MNSIFWGLLPESILPTTWVTNLLLHQDLRKSVLAKHFCVRPKKRERPKTVSSHNTRVYAARPDSVNEYAPKHNDQAAKTLTPARHLVYAALRTSRRRRLPKHLNFAPNPTSESSPIDRRFRALSGACLRLLSRAPKPLPSAILPRKGLRSPRRQYRLR